MTLKPMNHKVIWGKRWSPQETFWTICPGNGTKNMVS
jgi:hypothetical protein